MRRLSLFLVGVVAATVLAGCGGSSSTNTRQVLVDYDDDSFAGVFPAYFPASVTVHPGDTVHFRQAWNGEPHSVTMGTNVDAALARFSKLPQNFDEITPDQFTAAFQGVPFMTGYGADSQSVDQAGAQPCYLDSGAPPTAPDQACPRRAQPRFNGRQALYSSGFIPYAGNNGNSFKVTLSSDIAPGTYHYFCNFHGPAMQGAIVVAPKAKAIPTQSAVNTQAIKEVGLHTKPAEKVLKEATTGQFSVLRAASLAHFSTPPDVDLNTLAGDYLAGYGLSSPNSNEFFSINEFLPKTIHARVGQKVTWLMVGSHTVSFDVPRYFPELDIDAHGKVAFDHRAEGPIGGPGFSQAAPTPTPNPYIVDGGTWNGKGFRSSGLPPGDLVQSDNAIVGFSLSFGKAGTYQYACLIHPRMVGTVTVSA
jgi:plastocyanin